ncbi:hypothetical protein CJO66_21890 [Burkholderia ubonensis]|nr:hypothetical protein CJO70_19275 [Burkholderia ubonensis]PAJ93093.1 hypothetical protein CJO69_18650 [Burkholderia ubonensis]PAK05542.1 hypothetical protein CJO67_23135 [Burkholderia ubonensis]PAK12521.1 hypothetical protein CJO66_21890 [Burkholderia ubonensis]RQP68277.1 hypothetical protein DF013_29925 [Burkholderia ubonensis]
MRKQKRLDWFPGLLQIILGSRLRTGQISKCFVIHTGQIHRREATGTKCTHQFDLFALVRFDALSRFPRDQRRHAYHTF